MKTSIKTMTGSAPEILTDKSFDAIECRPFIEVAQKKDVSLQFCSEEPGEYYAIWRVDMDLVRASIENAIARAKQRKIDAISERLERLLSNGTSVQQVGFVLGSGPTYFFPEDIGKMVDSGPKAAHPFTLQKFSWLRCRPLDDGSQICEEHHKQICLVS